MLTSKLRCTLKKVSGIKTWVSERDMLKSLGYSCISLETSMKNSMLRSLSPRQQNLLILWYPEYRMKPNTTVLPLFLMTFFSRTSNLFFFSFCLFYKTWTSILLFLPYSINFIQPNTIFLTFPLYFYF